MRLKLVIGFAVLLFVLIQFSSAGIILSQPKQVYSLGDELNIKAVLIADADSSDFLKMYLNCQNSSKDFYLSSINLKVGEEKIIDTSVILKKDIATIGDCSIQASYLSSYSTTQSFQISDKINIDLSLQPKAVNPGENVKISGTAIKANSELVNGEIEIEIAREEAAALKFTGEIKQGKFAIEFSVPSDIKAGAHKLIARAYERKSDILNYGEENVVLGIRQEPRKIEVEIDRQSVIPGANLSFKGVLYDQANDKIEGDVIVTILDAYGDVVFENLVRGGEDVFLKMKTNSSVGYWKIQASYSNLTTQRLFYVEEKEMAKFEIVNNTLIITNVGNIPYRKPVQITIGGKSEIREVDLDTGEVKKLRLLAPDGDYDIKISDGSNELAMSGISLTGNAIGTEEIRAGSIIGRYSVVWIFLIVVFGLFILVMIQRVAKKKFISYVPKFKKKERDLGVVEVTGGAKEAVRGAREAEYALVLKGNKEKAGIVSIKVKNINSLKNDKESLSKIYDVLEQIYDKKGAVYKTGEYLIGVLTPTVTKTFKNEINAVNIALRVYRELKSFNDSAAKKIDFGIGINCGEVVVKVENKLKFTSLANTLNLAKKLSSIAEREVLLSKSIYESVRGEVRADKHEREGQEAYVIKSVSDRDRHKKFIDGFLERIKKQ